MIRVGFEVVDLTWRSPTPEDWCLKPAPVVVARMESRPLGHLTMTTCVTYVAIYILLYIVSLEFYIAWSKSLQILYDERIRIDMSYIHRALELIFSEGAAVTHYLSRIENFVNYALHRW